MVGHLISRAIMTFFKVINIALFHFESSAALIILSFVELMEGIILLTNILFLIFPLMHGV